MSEVTRKTIPDAPGWWWGRFADSSESMAFWVELIQGMDGPILYGSSRGWELNVESPTIQWEGRVNPEALPMPPEDQP